MYEKIESDPINILVCLFSVAWTLSGDPKSSNFQGQHHPAWLRQFVAIKELGCLLCGVKFTYSARSYILPLPHTNTKWGLAAALPLVQELMRAESYLVLAKVGWQPTNEHLVRTVRDNGGHHPWDVLLGTI